MTLVVVFCAGVGEQDGREAGTGTGRRGGKWELDGWEGGMGTGRRGGRKGTGRRGGRKGAGADDAEISIHSLRSVVIMLMKLSQGQ